MNIPDRSKEPERDRADLRVAQEAGCLVGNMAALMVKKQGGAQVIGAVGGIKIPPVDTCIAGYKFCAKRANAKIKVLAAYSQRLRPVGQVQGDRPRTTSLAEAKVLFQVAGGCGLGTLKAADEAKSLGHRRRQGSVQRRKARHDERRQAGRPCVSSTSSRPSITAPRSDSGNLYFDLENGGMDLGKMSPKLPAVPKSIIANTAKLKQLIINGKVRPPLVVPEG